MSSALSRPSKNCPFTLCLVIMAHPQREFVDLQMGPGNALVEFWRNLREIRGLDCAAKLSALCETPKRRMRG
jgi:hypothetical protein